MQSRDNGGGRLDLAGIVREARDEFSFELVDGVESILETSRAERNDRWVTSFLDARRAYYVHQNGGDYLEWKTRAVPSTKCSHVVFVCSVGLGFGSALPQPSGRFDLYLNDARLLSFRVTKESELWHGSDAVLLFLKKRVYFAPPHLSLCMDAHIGAESTASYGLACLKVLAANVRTGPNRIKVVPNNSHSSQRWFKLDHSRWAKPILKAHLKPGLQLIQGADHIRHQVGGHPVAFGDIHTHSGVGSTGNRPCGLGTIEENYAYARHVACLDFYSLTDHDWQLTDTDWKLRLQEADRHNEEGTFVTLPGYEWTSAKYGHRNIYYADSNGPLIKCHPTDKVNAIDERCQTPDELWAQLKASGVRTFTVPHHPSVSCFPIDWRYRNEEFDRLVEVYSCWGNSEYPGAPFQGTAADRIPDRSVQNALRNGHKLGIIASSDGHDAHPGNAQWSFRQPHLHPWLGSGRVAVLVERLTREEVFDALYRRRCYATTGCRMVLDFRVNGRCMGTEITLPAPDHPREFHIYIKGTSPLKQIVLVSDRGELNTWQVEGRTDEVEYTFRDQAPMPQSTFCYVRVSQMDGEMAWSSPIWVKNESE